MPDYTNKMILIYNPSNGAPINTMEYPWPEGTLELYREKGIDFVITNTADMNTLYVENNVAKIRPRPSWYDTDQSLNTGETFIIDNLPIGSIVSIGYESYEVQDGIFEFTSDIEGEFYYTVKAWPYPTTQGIIKFLPTVVSSDN